jgi:hypothetical protein
LRKRKHGGTDFRIDNTVKEKTLSESFERLKENIGLP